MKLVFSLQVMVIGMLVVFVGLVILIACIQIMSGVLSSARKKASDEPEQPETAPTTPELEASADIGYDDAESNSDELVAVIAAALAAYAQSGKTLVVRSVRKLAGKPSAWAQAARGEQLNGRF